MATTERTAQSGQPPEHLVVGEIVAPFGTQGAVKVLLDTDFPELVLEAKDLYIGDPPLLVPVEWAQANKGMVRLKLSGCDTRDEAESLRGQLVQVRTGDAPPPAEGEYYYYQLLGLQVWTEEGDYLGQVKDIFPTGSNEVLVVHGPAGEILLPAIESVVQEVDLAAARIRVRLMEGLR